MRHQEREIATARPLPHARLRILATSDLHMQITAFDYVLDRPNTGGSLAKIATLVKEARLHAARDGASCLLFDNGDTFQGTPLGDLMPQQPAGTVHPIVACMNHLGYDACGIGNHDFDHGLGHLADALSQYEMPVVCSNLTSSALPMLRKQVLMDCAIEVSTGQRDKLRVGVLSSLPHKTALWSRHHVQQRAEFTPAVPVLRREAAALRAAGADLIVVLAHMGLALFDEGPDAQNQVSAVAAIDDVDVVICGHTHLRFPGPDHQGLAEADCTQGTVRGKPVVQPGPSAADLGVIDLTLARSGPDGAWAVTTSAVRLEPVTDTTPEDPELIALADPMHCETRSYLAQPVAHLDAPMNSYFALAHPSRVSAMLAAAKRRAIQKSVQGTEHANLPLLAVASAPLTGGFDGPGNFIDLPAGPLKRRHVAGMNPYANHVWAVKTTGAQLIDWLERSVMIFNTLAAGRPDQLLIDPRIPGFRYDVIYGLTYQIDPRAPPRFETTGNTIAGNGGRVRDIRWQGEPLRKDQAFLVATTDHRAGGGGLYKVFDTMDIVVQGHAPMQEAVLDYLTAPDAKPFDVDLPWSFVAGLDREAILLTAPGARDHLAEIAHLRPQPLDMTCDGFMPVRVHL